MADQEYPIFVSALSEEDGGGFLAIAPDLRGCMADGETPEQAVAELRSAIGEWIDEAHRLGRTVPKPGAAAELTRQKNHEIARLLDAQRDLIESQDTILENLRREITRIKDRISNLSEAGTKEEGIQLGWTREGVPTHLIGA